MPDLDWATVTWREFVGELQAFRDRYHGSAEDIYLRARDPTGGLSAERIVWFLNRWACRLPTAAATEGLDAWIRENPLDEHTGSDILDPRVERRADEYTRLHDSMVAGLKEHGARNMSAAAASKALHLLEPELFVMWDRTIRASAPVYGDFMVEMHRLALRLRDEAPARARDDVGAYVSSELDYPVRKPLAKYLDEFNWYRAVGATRP